MIEVSKLFKDYWTLSCESNIIYSSRLRPSRPMLAVRPNGKLMVLAVAVLAAVTGIPILNLSRLKNTVEFTGSD